ncbi:MAG: carboxylate-amine ligase, partial [Thermoleophilaceae bacterium]
RVEDGLQYVARRNNTFSLHVHIGVRGADRAIAVCDRLRPVLPELLAISANSIFLDGRDSGLHSARSQIFTKSFPRCGVPDAFGGYDAYADYVDFLVRTGSIVEHTQLWWSVRPHHFFGTVEVRICDAQSSGEDSTALAGLIVACAAQAALDHDDGVEVEHPPRRLVEENLWRAIRHGLDGKLIDLERGEQFPAAAAGDRLLAWTAPARAALGIDSVLPSENGAQRQRRALAGGASIEQVYAAEVEQSRRTYAETEVRS